MGKRAKALKPTVTLTTENYVVYSCADGHVHIDMMRDNDKPLRLSFEDPEGAYEYAQAILRAYDISGLILQPLN